MTSTDAMRILQHASFYIFSTRVVGGPGKTMRGSVDVWQSMVMLDQCRRELAGTEMNDAEALRDKDSNGSLMSQVGFRRNGLMLCI